VDPSPSRDQEFKALDGRLVSRKPSSSDQIDLFTVLLHELAHAGGLGHSGEGLMADTLAAGIRILPDGDRPVTTGRSTRSLARSGRSRRRRTVAMRSRQGSLSELLSWFQARSDRP
jgi:hypothetical protein